MEAETAQSPTGSDPSPSSATAYPRWVMLKQYSSLEVHMSSRSDGSYSCSAAAAAADAKTLAVARTSLGHLIQFSLHIGVADHRLASPRVRIILAPDDAVAGEDVEYTYRVIAAHGDSLLVHVDQRSHHGYSAADYFVYNAGDAAANPPRPPSLSLPPPCHVTGEEEDEDDDDEEPVCHYLLADATGILRRGDGELAVAELRTVKMVDTKLVNEAELCLFRSGEWSVVSPTISYGDGTGGAGVVWDEFHLLWHAVVPVGDRRLCWVDLPHGVLAIYDDVFEEIPRLQYLLLPVDPTLGKPSMWNSNVCTAAGGGALKFVNVFPRCCCGSAGVSNCKHSRHAYTIHTWTMRIDDDGGGGGMEWVKDGIVDATELWALDAYKGLPRAPLDCPVVSMDEHEPHVVYFWLCERRHVECGGDDTLWVLKVDMRSKTIQWVSRRQDGFSYRLLTLIPSNVFHFFNSYPCDAGDDDALTRQRRTERQPMVVDDDDQLVGEDDASNNPTLQPSSSSSVESSERASGFLEAFLEISRFGLGGDELKAYRILSQDNGRRFRSLLRLPKNLRKDWLLIEIKASQS